MQPSFFIIGERKCGTSSLYRYLCQHPQVLPGRIKEPNFFGGNKPITKISFMEYLRHFPLRNSKDSTLDWPELDIDGNLYEEKIQFTKSHGDLITGEASANTLVDADPEMVKNFLPDCKFLIMLREPIARTWSHYRMYNRFENEGRALNFKLKPFEEMIQWEIEQILSGHSSPTVQPSLYIQSIKSWVEIFGWDQIKVISVHDLDDQSKFLNTLNQVYEFLNLSFFSELKHKKYNQAPSSVIPAGSTKLLTDFFKPYNEMLFNYLGRSDLWN